MKVGSLVFAVEQGLGILAKDFFDEGVVTDVMVVVRHGRRPEREDWYPGSYRITKLSDTDQQRSISDFCAKMDIMLFFETPFVWQLIDRCRQFGTKTALMVMYECMPKVLPAQPDLILCPSLLDLSYYPQGKYLPVPVRQRWYQRTRAEVFVHNAGHGGLKGRNGTQEFLDAIQHVKSDAKFVLRVQHGEFALEKRLLGRVKHRLMIEGTLPYDQLFINGDVFVFPEKFNGLSLPLQEARAAGMLVMATDRFPMNMWLPRGSLILPDDFKTNNVSPRCNDFEEAIVNPLDIAAKVDEFYGRDITSYSQEGREWAKTMSWETLKPQYLELLENLCKSN